MLPGGDTKAMKAWRLKLRQAVTENSLIEVNNMFVEQVVPNVRTRKK